MRTLLLTATMASLIGCAEVYKGPRVVHYDPDWFYVRYAPLINGGDEVAWIAAGQCPDARPAQLVDSAQYYPFDLRVSTFRCQPPIPSPNAAAAPEPVAPLESETAAPTGS